MKLKIKLPSVYTILFLLIILVAALTWVVPAGQCKMVNNELLGKLVPVAAPIIKLKAARKVLPIFY